MSRLSERVGALEVKYGEPTGPRRVYAVHGGPVDGNPEDFIRSCGLDVDDRDFIIHFTPFAPSPAGPTRTNSPWGWVGTPPAGTMRAAP